MGDDGKHDGLSALGDGETRRPRRIGAFSGFQSDRIYIRRLFITIAALALAYFVWLISGVLLLLFAAVVVAVLLSALATLIARYTRIPHHWALTISVLTVAAATVGFVLLFGSKISGQITEVLEMLPSAIDAGGARLGISEPAARLEQAIKSTPSSSYFSRVTGLGYTLLSGVMDLAVVLVAGVYLAADPSLYRKGAAKLLPPDQHPRVLDAMDLTATSLRLWCAGQLVTMVVVGTSAGLAYWWIGLPSPFALGLIAGLTNFVPFLGPLLGAIPALIFALAMDLETVMWTLGAVFVLQQLEGNVISPMVQKRAVAIPPAVVLFAIVIFGFLFGLPGVLLAVPLAVTIMVLVKKLWVRQTLGDHVHVPGEPEPEK